jgi:hypothetical protein
MSTRISEAFLICLLLAGCGVAVRDKTEEAKQAAHRDAMASAEGMIACAPPGADDFARVCTVERTPTQDGVYLTIRHPDGGFRRLLITTDGRGVIAGDGAEAAIVTPISGTEIEVALAGARYRLPATVRGREDK